MSVVASSHQAGYLFWFACIDNWMALIFTSVHPSIVSPCSGSALNAAWILAAEPSDHTPIKNLVKQAYLESNRMADLWVIN